MTETATTPASPQKGTILLVSGDLDKALLAFEMAAGMQAMGMQINMWFVLYGVNCIKKPRSYFSLSRWLPFLTSNNTKGAGRNTETDSSLQTLLKMVNHDGARHIPLSQLNFFGLGPMLLNGIIKRKGMASLEQLIEAAQTLGVKFKICQICVDAMACNTEADLVVNAEVSGISRYALEVQESHYNSVI